MNFADLLFAHGKRHYAVIFLRILRIEKAGLWLHNRLDSRMNKTRSHKIVNGRILYCLFFQSAQMALFPYILTVCFAEVVIIAVIAVVAVKSKKKPEEKSPEPITDPDDEIIE